MKRIILAFLAMAVPAFAQYAPPPVGAFTYSGSSWIAAVTSASSNPLGYAPPPAALYCFNSGTGKWVPADSSCFGGGGGGGTVSGQADNVVPLAGSATGITKQSHIDDGATAPNNLTFNEPLNLPAQGFFDNYTTDPNTTSGIYIHPPAYVTDLDNVYPVTIDNQTHFGETTDFGGSSGGVNFFNLFQGTYLDDGSGSLVGQGTIGGAYFFTQNLNNRATKTVANIDAVWNEVDQYGSDPVTNLVDVVNTFNDTQGWNFGNVTNAYGVWNHTYLTIGQPDGTNGPTNYFGFYNDDLSQHIHSANPYYSWDDSRGVRRVKEDSTFNAVGQAIEALYNPQFTKYTPGAANYERIVLGQWNSNVAEIGAEAGGTGVLRDTHIIGANVIVPIVKANVLYSAAGTALPSCVSGLKGAETVVSDATLPTYLGTYTSGGAVTAPVMCNGTNWLTY